MHISASSSRQRAGRHGRQGFGIDDKGSTGPLLRTLKAGAALGFVLLLAGCATNGRHLVQPSHSDARENAARIHTELGQGYFRQGNLETAEAKLKKAISFDPDYAPAHTVLGALYAHLGQMGQAEQQYRRAVAIKPKDGNTNNNLGAFLCREGKVTQALAYFDKALADPFYKTPAAAWTNIGTCQIRANAPDKAKSAFGKALKLDADYPDALYQMARVMHQQGDNFHASAYIQRYEALGAPNPKVLKLGYEVATRLGDAEGAQKYARLLRSKFPDSEQAQALGNTARR